MSLIHRYQSNGYNIVLDINSGCIHLVDLVTYEVLPFMEEGLSEQEIVDKLKDQYPEADIRTSVSECEKLKEGMAGGEIHIAQVGYIPCADNDTP